MLDIDLSNLAASRTSITEWVKALVGGGNGLAGPDSYAWDVDNDSDGIADSGLINPNLPLITSPEGDISKY